MSTSSTPRRILFVTGNANKLKEVRSILLASATGAGAAPFEVDSQDLDVPEVQGTTQEVATAKVKAAAEIVNGPCITEVRPDRVYPGDEMSCRVARQKLIGSTHSLLDAQDTALGFEALGGLPGPYIKYFMKAVGHEGELLQLPSPKIAPI